MGNQVAFDYGTRDQISASDLTAATFSASADGKLMGAYPYSARKVTTEPTPISETNPLIVSTDHGIPTYRMAAAGLTLYSTAAAVLLELKGSATKTVRIKKLRLWGQAATKFYTELTLQRATTFAATGTPVVPVIGQNDTGDAAATAVLQSYAGAATLGTGAAVIGGQPLSVAIPSATLAMIPTLWDFCSDQNKALILRGTSDVLQVYNTITGLGTATFGYEIVWSEDGS